ncbi:MAG TPA: hypothetical protein VGH65_11020 [Verrucomicrobiaceae bacterium]|jgi:hypothetical protein
MRLFRARALFLGALAAVIVCACSTEKVEKRQSGFTDSYENYQERRGIRSENRQKRTDAWYNRIMGNPVKSSDTGLKLPD